MPDLEKTTSESFWLMLHVPTYAIQTTNGGMQKFLIISKKKCAWLLMCTYVLMCVWEAGIRPTRKFILFPSVLGQIPTFSIYFSHSSPRIYSKRKCSDVSDTSLLKLVNPPHNFDFLYTMYRQLREILNTENINFTPAKALSKDVLGWQIVTFMW